MLSIRDNLIKNFHEIYDTCHEINWDGYNSAPSDLDSFNMALTFLSLLQDEQLPTDYGFEPDGMTNIDWLIGRNKILSFSFEKNGDIIWVELSKQGANQGVIYKEHWDKAIKIIGDFKKT